MDHKRSLCPCCSGKAYAECCEPFHKGKFPDTALQLMRSRYSAYALKLPAYIIETTHPKNKQYRKPASEWKQQLLQFSQEYIFDRLAILSFQQEEKSATVTFTAYLSKLGRDASFTEESIFEKVGERWLYLSGEILSGA